MFQVTSFSQSIQHHKMENSFPNIKPLWIQNWLFGPNTSSLFKKMFSWQSIRHSWFPEDDVC